ncbi:mechanosensitive ion channel [Sphingobium sufflavum]|uniref:mechanosensitive ion channel family protein n=1 Tax=Sphingobium sufflavum TaxID=1129547 RepID=UPI001F3C1270|nr:mechanosensitive ion channel domain-containing protein [Sphingobium sufflavum]MCE7798196.1 mechanosensitive ion channel [Sphingobium sufflavum]
MTDAIKIWLSDMGWTSQIAQLVIAALLVALAVLAGEATARWGAPACRKWVHSGIGARGALLGKRLPELLRFGTGAFILAFPLALFPFAEPALTIVAAGFSGALAMMTGYVLRIGGLPLWMCVFLAAMAFVLTMAAALGGVGALAASLDATALHVGVRRISLLSVVNFLLVAALLFAATRIANRLMTHAVGRLSALDLSQRALIQKLGSLAVVIVAILFGVDILGIDLTTLTVFSGALGLAVGFGLQKTFGNLIAGLILLMDKSVKPGDVVAVGDTFGAINKIGVRAVSVITRDGKEHLIPNEQLMTQPVENWSFSSRDVRIHIPVVISYGSDLKLAQKLMIQAAKASHRVLPKPEPSVWLLAFGDRGLEHDIMVWILDPELGVGNVQSDILNRLWELFQTHGIGLPYPQRDIHLNPQPAHRAGSANLRSGETPPTD